MNNIDWSQFEAQKEGDPEERITPEEGVAPEIEDFGRFQVEKEPVGEVPEGVTPEIEDFAQFEVGKKPVGEVPGGAFVRTPVRETADLFSSIMGFIPDMAALAHKIPTKEEMGKLGIFLPPLPGLLRLIPKEKAEEYGSAALMERFHKTTGEKFRPQTPLEEKFGEGLRDFLALSIPLAGRIPLTKALGMTLVGNLAKEGVSMLGFGPKTQVATKLGGMFLMGMVNPFALDKHIQSLYKTANAAVPEGAQVSASSLRQSLVTLRTNLAKGIPDPDKKPILIAVKHLLRKIKTPKTKISALADYRLSTIRVDELLPTKITINKFLKKPKITKTEKNFLKPFAKAVDDALEEYGQQNKEFLKPFRGANEAFGGRAESQKVGSFIGKIKNKITKVGPGTLFLFEVLTGHPKMAAATAAGVGLLKSAQLLKRVNANPTLRKHYLNVVKNSLKENVPATILNLQKLDAELKKSQRKSKPKPRT